MSNTCKLGENTGCRHISVFDCVLNESSFGTVRERQSGRKGKEGGKHMNKEEKIAEKPIEIDCYACHGQPPTHSKNQNSKASLHM